ncbi:MAG: response regulator [Lachnospiraceae bacterium]|nr:response regulator [Robinsoniella sp.]MDY3767060.1 response regulator [Lachnospiraceae bacterium]
MYSLIIADDEAIECRGMEMRIQNHFSNIDLLPSAHNGIEFLKSVEKYHPDIAIVDINMPGLTGLEALKILKLKSFSIKIIINTAYNDFDYIQEAIALGASGYLLKPIEHQNFIDTLNRVLGDIDRERQHSKIFQETNQMMERMKKAVGDDIMSSIILGQPNEESFHILCQTLPEPYQGGIFAAVLPVLSKEMGEPSQCLSEIEKIISAELYALCQYQIKQYQGIIYLYLILGSKVTRDNYQPWAKNIASVLAGEILKKMKVTVRFGFSQWKEEFGKMHEAFRECNLALHREENEVGFFDELKSKTYAAVPIDQCLDVISNEMMKKSDSSGEIKRQVEQFLKKLEEESYTIDVSRVAILNLLLSVYERMKSQYGLAALPFSCIKEMQELQKCNTQQELCDETARALQIFRERLQTKKIQNAYVEEAVLYIEKNYQKDLSLDEIAEKIGISSFYLSRLIKQQLKQNFIDLLTEIRLRHALQLIRQGGDTVKDIGKSVGYSNSNYFYKVFKKATGMTVGEMRDYFRQILPMEK